MSQRLKLGDHLVSRRVLFSHHGLYVGRNKVIHYAGLADGLQSGPVKISTLEEFLAGHPYEVRDYKKRRYSRRQAVARARARIAENLYNAAFNNCEHFVEWCIAGKHRSRQADIVMGVTGGLGGFLLSRGGAVAHAASRLLRAEAKTIWGQIKKSVLTHRSRKAPSTKRKRSNARSH
jgi:hypothetical protein